MQFSKEQFKPNLLTLLVIVAFSLFSFRNEDTTISDFLSFMRTSSELPQDSRVGSEMTQAEFNAVTQRHKERNPGSIHAMNIPKDALTAITERYTAEMSQSEGFRMHYGITRSGENVGIITRINESFKEENSARAGRYAITLNKQIAGPCPHLCD